MLLAFLLSTVLPGLSLSQARANEQIQVAFADQLEPYVFKDGNRGLEIEIVSAAFASRGITVIAQHFPQIRQRHALEIPDIDAVTTVQQGTVGNYSYSDPYITYHNVAVSLQSRHLDLKTIEDLRNYTVTAFPLAHKYLGQSFYKMAQANQRYTEPADQFNLNRLLYRGASDVVISDQRIFMWITKAHMPPNEAVYPVTVHPLFPKTHFRLACRQARICQEFNLGLKTIRNNGTYQKIWAEY